MLSAHVLPLGTALISHPYAFSALTSSNRRCSPRVPLVVAQQRFKQNASRSEETEIQESDTLRLDNSRLHHIGFKVIPQGHVAIVERLGKFQKKLEPGLHFLIPLFDKIAYSFPLKRVSFSVVPQEAFTKDNVKVKLGGDIILRIIEAQKAAYGATSPFSLATIYAQAAMRSAIGELTLDELLNQRDSINKKVLEAVNSQTNDYGLECLSYEIKGLTVPNHIEDEMARQVTAERTRRQTVLNSQGGKEAAINTAEGLKRAAELKSEGDKIAKINEAQGVAQQILIKAQAEADALEKNGAAIRRNPEAAALRLAGEALSVWEGMLGKGNTMIIPANANPLEVLLPQALSAFAKSSDGFKASMEDLKHPQKRTVKGDATLQNSDRLSLGEK